EVERQEIRRETEGVECPVRQPIAHRTAQVGTRCTGHVREEAEGQEHGERRGRYGPRFAEHAPARLGSRAPGRHHTALPRTCTRAASVPLTPRIATPPSPQPGSTTSPPRRGGSRAAARNA